jgi:aminoglycoside 3-N-acetyltransferase
MAPSGPVLVHCDALRAAAFVPLSHSRGELLSSHLDTLEKLAHGRDLWVPTFNYDFLRTGTFDSSSDPSQVGPITEAFRVSRAMWRTPTPVFNFAGTGAPPPTDIGDGSVVDPFDSSSLFALAGSLDGSVAWYGATLSSTTLLHHAERLAGGPIYRYDKLFRGVVRHQGSSTQLTLNYHVRPMGHHLDYDWPRLERETIEAGVVRRIGGREHARWAPARLLTDFWVGRLRDDPLALLDEESRTWVDRRLQALGRPFVIEDFK